MKRNEHERKKLKLKILYVFTRPSELFGKYAVEKYALWKSILWVGGKGDRRDKHCQRHNGPRN